MRPAKLALPVLLILASFSARADVGVRILLGISDENPATWDGSATVTSGKITRLDPWRFGKDDSINADGSWKISTAPVLSFLHLVERRKPPVGSNGVIVWLTGEDENTQVRVQTAQGNFNIRLGDLPYGQFNHLLDGRVAVDRIPPSTQLTSSKDEQDYPSAAVSPNGEIWLAYIEFKHNPKHDQIRLPMTTAPKDYSVYSEKPGGDQIFVKHFSNNTWGEPIALTPGGGDLYRPAVAIDGKGRPWVFWSENRKGNFEVFARALDNGRPLSTVQISKNSGSDVFAVAATDSKGAVWVAWQSWQNGRAAILASVQNGNAFSPPQKVSNSNANEWNPAIAADASGRVTVAWDSYRNGNYDVYARTAVGGNWQPEIPVAATARYEAYPSIAYDPKGRLWVAYEEGSEGWGKDFGADKSDGVPLYFARAIRLVGVDASGGRLDPGVDVGTVLWGKSDVREDETVRQADVTGWEKPDPKLYSKREPNAHIWPPNNPRNSLPRLRADASGRLWLAFRSNHPAVWGPLGTSWSEYVVSFDGTRWTGPIYLNRSDNLLDNRPALVTRGAGDLVVIESSDSRRDSSTLIKQGWNLKEILAFSEPDPYQNDLYASVLKLPPAPSPIAGRPLPAAPAPVATEAVPEERESVAKLRDFRLSDGGANYLIARGEFHRHSEISMDGGLDGAILDQWRYILDAASLDWVGCCDHDNGEGREYTWWITQKLTDIFYTPGKFAPLFSYERSVSYPEGHRNVVFAQRGVRALPRLPKVENDSTGSAPDTQMFYAYLRKYNGVVASHTSATDMGTDWRDNDPDLEPIVEIYQGMRQNYEMPDSPRAGNEKDSIGGWRPKGFVNLALDKGYKLGFQASSDHISTHQSYANLLVTENTREALIDALHKRHVYASTDNIIADVRSGDHLMGDAFATDSPPEIAVKLSGTSPFKKVVIVKDNEYVYSTAPGSRDVNFKWRDNSPKSGKTSYYYVRGEQENGELVWASPFWITYKGQ
jgi:hypothetical protein